MLSNGTAVDIAAFQMEAVHEDLAAGFFRVFSDSGLTCQAHFNRRILGSRGNFFATVRHRNVGVRYPIMDGAPAWRKLFEDVRATKPKALFFNTLQRDGIASFARSFDLPVLCVVHNPLLFRDSRECRALAQRGGVEVFGLAPHVVEALRREVPELEGHVHLHRPYEWMMDEADCYESDPLTLDIVIPGAVDYNNRGFESLVEWLAGLVPEKVRPFRLSILAGGPDRGRLEDDIRRHGLQRYFHLAPLHPETRRVPHENYLRQLYQCHAMMALLPAGRMDYLTSKISTGIMAALGTGRPIIAPASVGNAYGFTPIEVPEDSPCDLTKADISPDRLAFCRNEALQLRAEGLQYNDEVIRVVLRSLDHWANEPSSKWLDSTR